jgi:hypothetical protein
MANRKRYPQIDIYCAPAEGFLLGLAAVRENYGHDDCLPFQADIHILDAEAGDKSFRKIGSVWNAGYGGPPEVNTWLDRAAGEKADRLCHTHEMTHRGVSLGRYDLGDACETMAALFIDAQKAGRPVGTRNLRFRFDDDPEANPRKRTPLYYD